MPRPKKPAGDEAAGKGARKTAPIQIDRELVRMANTIAAHDDVTIAELLTPVLAPFIRGQYERVRQEMQRALDDMKRKGQ